MSRTSTRAGVIAIALVAVVTASIAIVVAVNSGGGPAQATSPAANRTISVTGRGTVQGIPDTLVANLSVHSHQSSVQAALNAIATDKNRVVSSLKNKGVPGGAIQTTDLELNPSYDNHGQISGYGASESISVRIHPLADVGKVLSAAATSAGNSVNIDGMALDIANDSTLLNSARTKAFKQAQSAAQTDAGLAGETLGRVVSIKESQEQSTPPLPFAAAGFPAADSAKSLSISAGKQPVSVTLAVVWALQ